MAKRKKPRPPADLIPFLDVLAQLAANSIIKEMEKQAAKGDDAPRHVGKDDSQQEGASR